MVKAALWGVGRTLVRTENFESFDCAGKQEVEHAKYLDFGAFELCEPRWGEGDDTRRPADFGKVEGANFGTCLAPSPASSDESDHLAA